MQKQSSITGDASLKVSSVMQQQSEEKEVESNQMLPRITTAATDETAAAHSATQ